MKTKLALVILLTAFGILMHQGCTKKSPDDIQGSQSFGSSGCVSCHLDQNVLKKVAAPLPPPSGEAGEG